jgi:hypothetical protein
MFYTRSPQKQKIPENAAAKPLEIKTRAFHHATAEKHWRAHCSTL